jgi:hypothetical protein
MQQKHELITREVFVQAIRDFKILHQGKLKDLLNKEKHPEAYQAFWDNPIIRNYLSRDATNITFDVSNRPILSESKTKDEHDTTDHYELKLYKIRTNEVLFRGEKMLASSDSGENFYSQGVHDYQWNLLPKLIDQPASRDVAAVRFVSSPQCELRVSGAKSFVRNMLTLEFQSDKRIQRFHPIIYQYPGHVAAALVIMDPSKNRILNAILINTVHANGFWTRNYWFDEFKRRFSDKIESYKSPNPYPEPEEQDIDRQELRQHIKTQFNLDIDNISIIEQERAKQKYHRPLFNFFSKAQPNVVINKSTKTACILELDRGPSWHELDEKYRFVYKSTEIEKIYLLEGVEANKSHVRIWIKPPTQVIDASHHLQTADDDGNCALYALNFVNAMLSLLNDSVSADKIYNLALDANKNNQQAQTELVGIFRNDLKSLLPCYYDPSKSRPKSPEELKKFHLQQRWNLGGKSIQILHPLKEEDFTPHQAIP